MDQCPLSHRSWQNPPRRALLELATERPGPPPSPGVADLSLRLCRVLESRGKGGQSQEGPDCGVHARSIVQVGRPWLCEGKAFLAFSVAKKQRQGQTTQRALPGRSLQPTSETASFHGALRVPLQGDVSSYLPHHPQKLTEQARGILDTTHVHGG